MSHIIINNYLPQGIENMTEAGVKKALIAVCSRISAQAKVLAPKRFGFLKNSIGYRVGDGPAPFDTMPKSELGGVVGTALEYGTYQEFGTRNIPPRPYLRPAIAKYTTNQTSEQIAQKIIDEAAKGSLRKTTERIDFGV